MDLVITSLGMISAVGHDVATACASIRAGLSRPRPIAHFSLLDPESQEPVPLNGHPLVGFAEGFNIVGFWIRIGLACVEDLVAYGKLPGPANEMFWSQTGLIAVTPPVNDARFESDDSVTPAFMRSAYLERLLESLPYQILPTNAEVVCTGQAGAISAIQLAQVMMSRRGLTRVIVLAVDSYLDPMSLDWLATQDRLKTEDNPVGLMPGEAGGCFLLESGAGAASRAAVVRARLSSAGEAIESNHLFSGTLSQGEALATAIREALSEPSLPRPFQGPVVTDCNGEQWRAYELGCARVRLAEVLGPAATFLYPCASVGDVGAANACVAICVAVRSLERRYAGYEAVLVVSSSDSGLVGAVCVSRG